nr:hypothetical protein MACL_00002735 [Theileria orientalis]
MFKYNEGAGDAQVHQGDPTDPNDECGTVMERVPDHQLVVLSGDTVVTLTLKWITVYKVHLMYV